MDSIASLNLVGKWCKKATVLFICAILLIPHLAIAAWDMSALWNTGDINVRPTRAAGVYDRDQTGSSVAPIGTDTARC